MAARRMKEAWWVDFRFEGERIRRKSPVDTRRGAEEYERRLRAQLLDGTFEKEEVPTFGKWWKGRFWQEWVVGRKNKPSEVRSKEIIYRVHLERAFGDVPLDEIDVGAVARFRASLVAQDEPKLSEKRINNILAVLSKPLHYAVDTEVIARAPKIGLFKVERPEIVSWSFEEYARILDSALREGPEWYVAAALSGEAGLRIGEVKALRWREDLDLVAGTLTVNQQTRNGVTGTPKGRTRRTVPMTATLLAAVKALSQIRTGLVVRNLDGTAKTDGQADAATIRICRRAGLPVRGWHILRHSFGTHAALFGVNPWRLQTWMGHKRIDETMLYVHVAATHARPIPEAIVAAGARESEPDRRVIAMLGARGHQMGTTFAEGGVEQRIQE